MFVLGDVGPTGVDGIMGQGASVSDAQRFRQPQPSTLNPQHRCPQASTPNPQLSTLNPQPSALNPQFSTHKSQPSILNPQPATLKSQPSALSPNPKPQTLHAQAGKGFELVVDPTGLAEGCHFAEVLLVSKAHRLLYRLDSRLQSNKEEKKLLIANQP